MTIKYVYIALITLIFISIWGISCKFRSPSEAQEKYESHANYNSCNYSQDTVIADNFFIKYIQKDSFCTPLITINGKSLIVDDYGFNSSSPNGLIPSYFLHDRDRIILEAGSGQHHRELISCELTSGKINITKYLTELSIHAKQDIFVTKHKDQPIVNTYDRLTKKKESWNIPAKFQKEQIAISKVYEDEIVIEFENEDIFTIPIK